MAGEPITCSLLPSRVNGQVRLSDCISTPKVEHEATIISRGGEYGQGRQVLKQCTYHIAYKIRNSAARSEGKGMIDNSERCTVLC
jgi:hypothetical protein